MTFRADERGFCAAVTILQLSLKADLVARATVANTTVPKNMAEAMVDSGAVSEAENPFMMLARWDGVQSAVRVPLFWYTL